MKRILLALGLMLGAIPGATAPAAAQDDVAAF